MTRVIAHRAGAYPDLPGEQTLAHVERALSLGASMIEVDLRQTRDGHVVCVHDPEIAGVEIAAASLETVRARCRDAGIPAPPLLVDLLQTCAGRCALDLELKVAGIERQVIELVHVHFSLDQAIFKCFDDRVVRALKDAEPRCTAGLLLGVERAPYLGLGRLGELFPLVRLLRCRADFVSPNHQLVRLRFVRRMHLVGYPVYVWTVNDERIARRLIRRGADAVITDEVARALHWTR